jgi:hypothetical protein
MPLDSQSPPQGVSLVEGVWPNVKSTRTRDRDAAEAGPTGAPWVDSNGWRIRLAQALDPGKTLWLMAEPPKGNEVVSLDSFALPAAEATAYGARWVITLSEEFRKGIEAGSDAAMKAWNRIVSVLQLAERHPEWRSWKVVAALGVISDFAGENEFLGGEFLNLAERRDLSYRVISKAAVDAAALAGLKAVIYIDKGPPDGELLKTLLAFVHQGGTLIAPPGYPEAAATQEQHGYGIHPHGAGRIATPKQEWGDPFLLAGEVHLLMSHREDVLRVWNGGLMNSYYLASPDGKQAVVHLVNYNLRSRLDTVTLGLAKPFETAEVHTVDSAATVKPVARRLGAEVPLPPFTTYSAVQLKG